MSMGHKKVIHHLVFYVKIYFTWKDRWVLVRKKTPSSTGSTHPGTVSIESVKIVFSHAALNRLDTFSADTRNACL